MIVGMYEIACVPQRLAHTFGGGTGRKTHEQFRKLNISGHANNLIKYYKNRVGRLRCSAKVHAHVCVSSRATA